MANTTNCGDCGQLLDENIDACPKCGSKKKVYSLALQDGLKVGEGHRLSHKRKGLGEIHQQLTRRKPSVDPRLSEGVKESRVIDREKGTYDQVITDVKTGEVIHEEHTTLKKHNEDKKKKSN